MSSISSKPDFPEADLASFAQHLHKSKRILAVLGAGVSASSGLPTFRGAGGYWRSYDATRLATPLAFRSDPGLVWQFYSYRRHMALNAKPNRAHLALAELARKKGKDCVTFSQNVDGLSPRAGHPAEQLKLLHGNLFDVKCWDEEGCGYLRKNDFTDPIVPALALPTELDEQDSHSADITEPSARKAMHAELQQKTTAKAKQALNAAVAKKHALLNGIDISNANIPIPTLDPKDLLRCPQCEKNLLRPGVVWFGESLPEDVMADVMEYMHAPEKIDLMMVIGTSSQVHPAAGYAHAARMKGARVAIVNMDRQDARDLQEGDWFFEGDAAEIVPEMLKSVIGETAPFGQGETSQ